MFSYITTLRITQTDMKVEKKHFEQFFSMAQKLQICAISPIETNNFYDYS